MEFDELVDTVLIVLAQSLLNDIRQWLLNLSGVLLALIAQYNHLVLRDRLELLVRLHMVIEHFTSREVSTTDRTLPPVDWIRVNLCVDLSCFASFEAF